LRAAIAAAHTGANNLNVLRAAFSGRTSEPHQSKALFGIFIGFSIYLFFYLFYSMIASSLVRQHGEIQKEN
jgi:hypothetical protein